MERDWYGRDVTEIELAVGRARAKWKDTGDPVWAYAEGALAWVLGYDVTDEITEVLENPTKEY